MQFIRPFRISTLLCLLGSVVLVSSAEANTTLGPLATQDIERQQQERLQALE